MALTPRVPSVLEKTRAAYSLWFKIIGDFPKTHRYGLGGKIEERFLKMLEIISSAVYLSPDKKYLQLSNAIIELDGLKFFLQLAWENKCLPNQKYADLSERLEEVGRMLGGWRRGLEKQNSRR